MKYLNAINIILYNHQNSFRKILKFFADAKTAFNKANFLNLKNLGLREQTIKKFLEMRELINVNKEFEKILDLNISILSCENFPRLLREIYDPPLILYAQGNLEILKNTCLSIVGTRNISAYSKEILKKWIPEFTKSNLALVSGYAYGVDFEVHKNTLENNGQTIAVLASGLDLKYPQYKKIFEDEMSKKGLFLTEYPLGVPSIAYHFPIRNRIISGLSSATLIIEAQEKSGSLITAKSALDQNREILAVPGNVFNLQSVGTNLLIKNNEAELVLNPENVLEKIIDNFPVKTFKNKEKEPEFDLEIEKQIYEILNENLLFDEILQKIDISGAELSSILGLMEIKGFIKNLGGGRYGK